jgi:phenylalanyl-tRNA synthetase alpha chain
MQATELDRIVASALAEFAQCDDPASLENAKARYLGRTGALTEQLKGLAKLAPAERPAAGATINEAKARLEAALNARRAALADEKLSHSLAAEALDVTLPGRGLGVGGLHPITRVLERVETLFRSLGFEVADGPEIEDDFHNFTALNTPENHPARSMQDTFYVEAAWCCARKRRRSRFVTWKRTRRRSRSSRRAACTASTAMRRIHRCSIRSRDCGSIATSRSPTSRA